MFPFKDFVKKETKKKLFPFDFNIVHCIHIIKIAFLYLPLETLYLYREIALVKFTKMKKNVTNITDINN